MQAAYNKLNNEALYLVDTSIASGEALSGVINAAALDFKLISVQTPGTWTAADIGFRVSRDGSTFVPLYYTNDAGALKRVKIDQIATGAAGVYSAPPEAWPLQNYPYFKLESLNTSTEAAANQAAARDLVVGFLR